MTIREKAGQLNQLDGRGTIENLKILIRKGEIGSVMNITEPEIVNELQEIAYKQSRSGIPWFSHATSCMVSKQCYPFH